MKRQLQGRYITISTVGEKAQAFVPFSLPPKPPINWNTNLQKKFEQATTEIGRLDSMSILLPDTGLFLYMYVRKEALLSSMIEGTQSSLSDLLLFELNQKTNKPLDNAREVSNYVAALEHGINRMKDGFPLSSRLLCEIHNILLHSGRGSRQTPGEFRRSQNWIGGTRPGNANFVPPPATEISDCMSQLERFLHDEKIPILPKIALAHLQFETIHPFLDGNGRLGRLMITLLLCKEKMLHEPMLYLSLYFKTHRRRYYELLNYVRETGDWETWLDFFAEAVAVTAGRAVETAQSLLEMASRDREKISKLGRASASVLETHRALMQHPISSLSLLVEKTSITYTTVNKALGHLLRLGIVEETTHQQRNRMFRYSDYLEIMNQGTELPED